MLIKLPRHSRKAILKGLGTCLPLPFLETFSEEATPKPVQRFVAVSNPFGMIRDAFFPKEVGFDAKLPENLKSFESLRGDFTVFSKGGFIHTARDSFLTLGCPFGKRFDSL